MQDQDRLARGKANDEALMPASIDVVVQEAVDSSFAFNLDITSFFFERALDFAVVSGYAGVVARLSDASGDCPDQRE